MDGALFSLQAGSLSRTRAAKSKVTGGEGVWWRGAKKVTFSSRGFAARFRARGYAPWAYAPTWACSQARPYSATRSCWNSHSKERTRWILRLRKQSSRPKSRSALGLVLFQWHCFVLYKKVYLFLAFFRRLIDYFAPRRRSTTILKREIKKCFSWIQITLSAIFKLLILLTKCHTFLKS